MLALYSIVCLSLASVALADCPRAFNRVMTIVFENEDQQNVMADPYMGTTLPAKGYLLTNMNGVTHPSQPNYLAMISGDTHLVLGDYNVNINTNTIVDLLEPKGLTWKSYQEDYAGTCNTASTIGTGSAYARKHNPFISFTNIQSNSVRCANIVNSAQLDIDAASGNLPNYMFYTPNLSNDGHDTNIPTLSAFLQGFLEPKLVDPAYSDVLFVITFDESLTTWNPLTFLGDHIYTILLGQGIIGKGATDNNKYNHYSILATIEKNYNLGNLGTNDASATPVPLNYPSCPIQNIKNVVVVAFENRSFDTLFGFYARTRTGVDGIPEGANNYCSSLGQTVDVQPVQPYVEQAGPDHSVSGTAQQMYGMGSLPNISTTVTPNMSGFCDEYGGNNHPVLQQVLSGFPPEQLPIFTTLASEFGLFDRWFAGVPGPTIPNRLFLMSAQSTFGDQIHIDDNVGNDVSGFPQKSIYKNLENSGISWRNYFMEVPTSILMSDVRELATLDKIKYMPQFFTDAAAGKLAQFTFLDPLYENGAQIEDVFGPANDGSPGTDFARAEAFLKQIYEALANSPQWNETLLLVTFDEHGGHWDHVAPPTENIPSPDPVSANSSYFKFDRLGVRVPALAISPWIPKGSVFHLPSGPYPNSEFEHSSLSATLKNIFNLPNFLTKRDAWAGTFDEYTRILSAPRTDTPKVLPAAPAFNTTQVQGVIPDLENWNLAQLITDLQNVFAST